VRVGDLMPTYKNLGGSPEYYFGTVFQPKTKTKVDFYVPESKEL
jgi:hypothetical protein